MTQEDAFSDGLVTNDELKSLIGDLLQGYENDQVFIGLEEGTATGARSPFFLKNYDRSTHFHVMGRSGGGKSRLLEFMIRQDISRGNGVCIIDPHGELYWNILRYIIRYGDNSMFSRLYLINPSQKDYLIHFNPFVLSEGYTKTNVDNFISFLEKMWEKSIIQTPTIKDAFTQIFYVSLLAELPILSMRKLFFSEKERESFFYNFVQKCKKIPEETYVYWDRIVNNPNRNDMLGIAGAHSRIDYILSSPAIQLMTLNGPSIKLDEVIAKNGIVLVNLALSPVFSMHDQKMFGTLLLNEFVRLFSNRSDSFMYAGDKEQKKMFDPYFVYIDEFQFFISKDLCEIITGGRKFGLNLTVANQAFEQIPVELLSIVKNITTNKAYFSVKDVKTAIEIWQQTGNYSPRIKDTATRFYSIPDGHDRIQEENISYDGMGRSRTSVSSRYLSRSRVLEDKINTFYSPEELDRIEGKKIQNMERRIFLFHSDEAKDGMVLKTEWCFDIECSVNRIESFHKQLYEQFPERYSPLPELELELEDILYNYERNGVVIPEPKTPEEIIDEEPDNDNPFTPL